MSSILDGVEVFMEPATWPRSARRAFLLTIPISGPGWAAGMIVIFIAALWVAVIAICLETQLKWFRDMWRRP